MTASIEARLKAELNAFATLAVEELATYPPQLPESAPRFGRAKNPYKGRPKGRRVLKSGYARTGTLGHSWSWEHATRQGNSIVAKVGSSSGIAPYNKWVQGKEQTRDMKRRGWPTARLVIYRHWSKTLANVHRIFRETRGA